VKSFFRENPQVLVLLVICLVLGVGTFVAVLIGLASSGGGSNTGEPSGAVVVAAYGRPTARVASSRSGDVVRILVPGRAAAHESLGRL
jgi:hypothetical protein